MALKHKLWVVAKATTVPIFEGEMSQLKAISSEAYEWLKEKPPCHWSNAHFKTWTKCDMLLNNYCKSFNSAILRARDKPIITLLEMVRFYIMQRMVSKPEHVTRWHGEIRPMISKVLEKAKAGSCNCIAVWAGALKFEVRTMDGARYVVELDACTYSCRKWDLFGILCSHTVVAIRKKI